MSNISDVMRSFSSATSGKKSVEKPTQNEAQKTGASSEASNVTHTDEVLLSPEVTKALDEATFDATKVASIKEAIENGSYPLDARKIAENMVSLEKLIGG